MKMTIQILITTLMVGGLATIGGCASETVETSTLVCTPGERKCDETSTKILECHPTGAAWSLVNYCSADAFCVNAVCTGDGASGFEGQGNPGASSSTSFTEIGFSPDTQEPDVDASDEDQGDVEEPPVDSAEDAESEEGSDTEEPGEPDVALEERGEGGEGEEGGERRNVILFEDDFTATEAGPASSSPNWTSHYCDDKWLLGSGYLSPITNNICSPNSPEPEDSSCLLGFTTIDTDSLESPCSESPVNNYVTAKGQANWNEYTVSARFITWDDDTLGVIAGFQDPANFYLLTLSKDVHPLSHLGSEDSVNGFVPDENASEPVDSLMLLKVSGDFESGERDVTLLGYEPGPSYSTGKECEMVVSVFGTSLQSWVQCEDFEWTPILDYQLEENGSEAPGLPGTFGLYSYGTGLNDLSCESGQCGFLGVTVTTFPFDVVVD